MKVETVLFKGAGSGYLIMATLGALTVTMFFLRFCDEHEFFKLIQQNQNMFVDYAKVYSGACMITGGAGAAIYDPQEQFLWLNKTVAPAVLAERNYMQYPPYVFALMIPLARIPLVASYSLWCALTFFVSLFCLFLLRRGRALILPAWLVVALLSLGSVFSLNNVLLGQTGWLNLALVAAFFAALLAKKDIPGGMALAFSTIKPQLLLLLFLPVLFLKRWQLLAVAFGCEMLLLLLAGSAVGFSNIIGYPGILLHAESAYARNGLNPELMVCLRAPLSLLLPQSMAFLISGLTVLAGAALICLLWRHADSAEKQIRATALSAVVYLIFSPHAFLYDCLLLIIPLLLTYPSNGLSKAFAQMTGNERGWLAILLLAPLLAWCPYLCHEAWATLFMLVVNLVLLLFGWTSRFAYLQPAILPEPEEAAGSDK